VLTSPRRGSADGERGAEVELKFLIDADQGARLFADLRGGARPRLRTLTSIYYDTPRHALRRSGFVLRMRGDGRSWMQTVKSRALADGRLGRGEWERAAPTADPDVGLVRLTPAGGALPRRAILAPLFTVEVKRLSMLVDGPSATIEVSFDTGEVTAGGRAAPLCELELELKSGTPAALFDLARALSEDFALTASFVTKADRGFALIARSAPRAAHFEAPVLSPGLSAGDGFAAMARAAVAQIATNAAHLRASPNSEAVHQLRVGVRRLRATLSVFKKVVADGQLEAIKTELKWLTGELDRARNLDVFIAAKHRGPKGLARRLRGEQAAARARAIDASASGRFRALLLSTFCWIETGPWTGKGAPQAQRRDGAVAEFAAKAMDRRRKKILRRGRRLADLDRRRRHKVRIQAKILRYAGEDFAQVFPDHPRRAERFLGKLKDLQETLGALNDIAAGEALLADLAKGDAASDFARAQADRETKLIDQAQDELDDFGDAARFWL